MARLTMLLLMLVRTAGALLGDVTRSTGTDGVLTDRVDIATLSVDRTALRQLALRR